MASYLDIEKLSELVRSKRVNRGLREMAAIIGVSPSTILRVEKGTVPDVSTFLAICDWIKMPPANFIKNMNGTQKLDTSHSVCARLRTDKKLDPEVLDAIAALVSAVR